MRSPEPPDQRSRRPSHRLPGLSLSAAVVLSLPLVSRAQIANSEAMVDLVAKPGGAGLGALISSERSPYRGDGQRRDTLPVYLYEGDRFFLRSDRLGLKFAHSEHQALEMYLQRRVEGLSPEGMPAHLQGLKTRSGGMDLGLTLRLRAGNRQTYASVTQNLGHDSRGQELNLGAHADWTAGRWTLRPAATLSWRSSRTNNFYFGVQADEATLLRPAYRAGAGVDVSGGWFGSYQLSEGWRLVGGVGATRYSSSVRASPIVEPGTSVGGAVGAVYSFGAETIRWKDADSPTWVRLLYGQAAENRCDMLLIMTLRCTAANATRQPRSSG